MGFCIRPYFLRGMRGGTGGRGKAFIPSAGCASLMARATLARACSD